MRSLCRLHGEWCFHSPGSLLAKACKSAMILAQHTEDKQENAYNFGKHMAYASQVVIISFPTPMLILRRVRLHVQLYKSFLCYFFDGFE